MPSVSSWIVSLLSIAGIIIRPFRTSEFIWAVAGALVLLLLGPITPAESWAGMTRGADVYLFLTGMMLLAETARSEKLFDWLAAYATKCAEESARHSPFPKRPGSVGQRWLWSVAWSRTCPPD